MKSPKNSLPLYSLFIANGISMVGNMLTNIAVPWFVLQTTGSAVQTGVTGFFSILPVVLAGTLGGALVDRMGYKRTSIAADLASGVTVALIPAFYLTTGLPFWLLMALVFLGALLDTPGSTARAALVPELAEMAGMPIERAASINQIVERSSRLVGAPLAGVLIAAMGTANVLWFDAVSFLVSALIVSFLVLDVTVKSKGVSGKYFQEIWDGFRFIGRDATVFAIVLIVMITNFMDTAFGGVIAPYYIKQVFGDALSLGLVTAASGGGAVLGALAYSAWGHRFSRRWVFCLGFFLTGLRFFAFSAFPPLGILVASTFLLAIGSGPLNPIIDSVTYARVPTHMRGRIFGAIQAGAWAAMPLGMLLGGVLIEAVGLTPLLIGLGILYSITTLSVAFIPAMAGIDRDVLKSGSHEVGLS